MEVARRLDVPKATLYGWRYKGKGPRSHRVGKHLRYRWSDVLEWLEAQEKHRSARPKIRRSCSYPL